MLDLALTLNQPFTSDTNAQEFWNLAFAHAALECSVGIFFLNKSTDCLTTDKCSKHNLTKTLRALPLYGIDKIYTDATDLNQGNDLPITIEILNKKQLTSYLLTAHQLVHWECNHREHCTEYSREDSSQNHSKPLAKDQHGYLLNPNDWNKTLAEAIAKQEKINLNQEVWQIIQAMRLFYHQYRIEPTMRAFIAFLKAGEYSNSANSTALHHMFPGGVIKQLCKIAGLPKPVRCFT